ncbi:MAG: homocysteine S-methyltransferase family protein [Verrucomicrobiales bacterium]|nr:homocysteine S-methyltransferase family protein [Verrucomicrobiota bacterium JB025]
MKRKSLGDELQCRPLCCDGSMGMQLMERGLPPEASGVLWNAKRYEEVGSIHMAYRMAGCDLLTTNSYGGSEFELSKHGLSDRMAELNRAAAEAARSAAGADGWVLGDVGPFGDVLRPQGELTADELREVIEAQIDALLDGGADAVLLETMSDPAAAVVGVEAARNCSSEVLVIVSYAFELSGAGGYRTMTGASVEEGVKRVLDAGADVVGANCGMDLDLDDYAILGRRFVAAAGGKPVIVQPNAGARIQVNGKDVYDASPEQMAEAARRLLEEGVRIVGGCCGTTPEHLAAMSQVVRAASSAA